MQRWGAVTLGPFALPDGQLVMRTPRLSDGPAWSRARLANRTWLERAFPAWGDDWAAEQSETAWAQRWWQLRRRALAGRAFPFVLVLDGRLIGELGIDAVDEIGNGGEASVWMVREHGSAGVMLTASVLLIHHAFAARRPIDRLVSPVATAAREGRGPALSAVGLEIEGTVGRKVGDKGMVDHDVWVIHNTAARRASVAAQVAELPSCDPEQPRGRGLRPMLAPAARAAVREARNGARQVGPRARLRTRAERRGVPRGMTVEPITLDGRRVGAVWARSDLGTANHELVASVDAGVADAVLRAALRAALDAVEPGLRPVVRVPVDPDGRSVPDDTMLRGLGLTYVASFTGNPEGRRPWAGEHRWELIT